MKSFFSFLLVMCFTSVMYAQENKDGLARVNKIQGIECYFLSEPLRTYEVLIDKGTGLKASSIITGGVVNEGVSAKAAQFVNRIIKEANEEGVKIDAVIYSSGKRAIGVKFTDESTESTSGIGRVKRLEGAEIYVLAEPMKSYNVVSNKGGGMKVKSLMTAGLVNNSIEDDISKMVSKIQKDTKRQGGVDAVIYGSGKKANGVKFK